jgi:hypothetical protein
MCDVFETGGQCPSVLILLSNLLHSDRLKQHLRDNFILFETFSTYGLIEGIVLYSKADRDVCIHFLNAASIHPTNCENGFHIYELKDRLTHDLKNPTVSECDSTS